MLIEGNLESKVLTDATKGQHFDEFPFFSAFGVLKSLTFSLAVVKDFPFQDFKIQIPI